MNDLKLKLSPEVLRHISKMVNTPIYADLVYGGIIQSFLVDFGLAEVETINITDENKVTLDIYKRLSNFKMDKIKELIPIFENFTEGSFEDLRGKVEIKLQELKAANS